MRDFTSAPYPPPDVVHHGPPSAPHRTPQTPDTNNPASSPHTQTHTPQRADPHPPPFLIIGLFALRLTQRILASLPDYPHRAADLTWLRALVSQYDPAYDLAKLSSGARLDFLATYPRIVGRMKSQDVFPGRFMGMNPLGRGVGMERSDAERKEIIDFVDAAAEWGSVVLLPRDEAEGVLKMADRRLVADLEAGRGGVGVSSGGGDSGMAREEPRRRVLQDRHVLQNEDYGVRRR